jgi:hypothetical protein
MNSPDGYYSITRRSTWVIRLLVIGLAIDIAAVISDLGELALINQGLSGGFITRGEANANDARQGLIGFLQMITFRGHRYSSLFRANINSALSLAIGSRLRRERFLLGYVGSESLKHW